MSTNHATESNVLIFLRPEGPTTPCLDYVVRLFCRTWALGFQASDTTNPESADRAQVALAYCGVEEAAAAARKMTQPPLFTLVIRPSGFFGDNFLKSAALPAQPDTLMSLAAPQALASACTTVTANMAELNQDVLAAAFWLLSRYEEYVSPCRDAHGRFLCLHSVAPKEFYDQPLVNRWFEAIARFLFKHAGMPMPPAASPVFALTHDVDLLRKYAGIRGLRQSVHDFLKSPAQGMAGLRTLAGLERDPYDSFDDLARLKERVSAPSTFFFLAGGTGRLDGDYRLNEPRTRRLLSIIRATGDEVALHPSYDSPSHEDLIRRQQQALTDAAGLPVRGSRQHYLRFKTPQTWRALTEAGLLYDSSVAFADRAGFRCGWSGCFHPFDLETMTQLPIVEIPLILMDVSVAHYEKISSEHALERVAGLLDASVTRGGAFVMLWHNTLRDRVQYPGFWESFEYFLSATTGGARFTTLGALYDEYDGNPSNVTG